MEIDALAVGAVAKPAEEEIPLSIPQGSQWRNQTPGHPGHGLRRLARRFPPEPWRNHLCQLLPPRVRRVRRGAAPRPGASAIPGSAPGAADGIDEEDDDDVVPEPFHLHRSPSPSPARRCSPLPFPIVPFSSSASPTPGPAPPIPRSAGAADEQDPLRLAFVLALLAYVAAVMVGILPDSKDTIAGWSTVPKAVFIVLAVLTVALLAVGFMAAGYHLVGSRGDLSVSASCAKLGAMLSSALLVVAISCKLGPWGCVAAVPSAAVIAGVMAVVWIWGDERAARETVRGWWRRLPHHQVSAEEEEEGDAKV